LEAAFASRAGSDAHIDLAELQQALGLRSEYLARRVLTLLDTNGDGVVSREEFLAGAHALLLGSNRDKLWFAFRLYDHDGDGFLDAKEITRMLAMALAENDIVERTKQPVEQLVRVFMKVADRNADQRVSFDEFVATAERVPNLVRKMTRNEAIWLAPNEDLMLLLDEATAGKTSLPSAKWKTDGALPWVFILLFAAINAALFVVAFTRSAQAVPLQNIFLRLGHAFAKCADFDGALILVPMMRRLLTRVRATWLGRLVPIDDAIDFHKIVGHSLFGISLAHAAASCVAYAQGHPMIFALARTARGGTGFALVLVFAVMWFFSLSFIRRSNRFELFYFTHLLYVAWFVLAIAHAPSFALWAGVPVLGFVVEQILRLARRAPASALVSLQPMRSGVTRLEVARPSGMHFGAADYCFLRIPAIAKREWHPFTISSAPERDHLVFHIRSLGNWTTALRRHAEVSPNDSGLVVYVDGPYGTPSARIFDSPIVILIGAGIGVTPFASVLESIALRGSEPSTAPVTLEQVYFFWLTQDQYSFEWFADLLMDLEQKDTKRLLDLHLCMTGIRTGATAVGLEIARELMKSAGRSDIITGLKTHTHLGPPDWQALLGPIVQRHHSRKIHVYFCGPPGLGNILKPICTELGMIFREEKF
jgi:predicted ferric reductase/Ca2+-binding EF-hand superfamily protein